MSTRTAISKHAAEAAAVASGRDDGCSYRSDVSAQPDNAAPAAMLPGDVLDALASRVLEHPTLADAIARRVVEMLHEQQEQPDYRAPAIATTQELCKELRIERTYAYAHREALGARKLGDGPKARLRWDMETARAFMASRSLAPQEKTKRRRSSRRSRRAAEGGLTAAGNALLAVPDFSV